MNLNVLVRGQSNAILMMELDGWAGHGALTAEVERLLGFDGVNDTISLVFERYNDGGSTAFGGTALVGEWLTARNGDWRQGWNVGQYEQSLLNVVNGLPASQKDDPTAILWLHSEYDSANANLTTEQWMSAVRFDAAQVRAALGQSAATTPYMFISAMPYWGTETGHQSIRQGMERLAADGGFNASIAARMQDIDATTDNWDNNWSTVEYGGGHIDGADAMQTVLRSARSIAEEFAAYAKPGSIVAQAGGNIANLGPQVIGATKVAANQLRINVAHDKAGGFAALDADAANGVGWSVRTNGGEVSGTAAQIEDGDSIVVTFSGNVDDAGTLFYGYGYGRLVGAGGEGRGNAVYDSQGLPIWVGADGLKVGTTVAPPQEPPPQTGGGSGGTGGGGTSGADTLTGTNGADSLSGGGGNDRLAGGSGHDTLSGGDGRDTLFGGPNNDRLDGGAGNDALRGNSGNDTITTGAGVDRVLIGSGEGADRVTDFALGTDRVELTGGLTAGQVTATAGTGGLVLRLPDGTTLTLEGVGAASATQLGLKGAFAGGSTPVSPTPSGRVVTGTAGDDWLTGGTGADTLTGGAGSDDLQGLGGNDVLRGGTGSDGLTGGAGADIFVFARGDGRDWIEDFQPGVDRVRLEGIGASEVTQVVETRWSYTGVALSFGDQEVFVAGATARLTTSELLFV
jgi:hypothetical protein